MYDRESDTPKTKHSRQVEYNQCRDVKLLSLRNLYAIKQDTLIS